MTPETILRTGLDALGIGYTEEQIGQIVQFSQLLLETNRVMNLTAIVEPEQVMRLHMLDSATLLRAAPPQGARVCDVGCGAGFPGLPLKLLRPDLAVTLVDSQRKRVDFLNRTIETLGLDGVTAVHTRAEDWAGQHREEYDWVVSRAVAGLPVLSELCLPLTRVGGWFCAMKSVGSDEEIAAARRGIGMLGGRIHRLDDVAIPGAEVTHRLVWVEKARPTPAAYPRPYRKISAKPL